MDKRLDLWRRLEGRSLTAGKAPTASVGHSAPWFSKVLMGISGWIASLFFINAAVGLALLLSRGNFGALIGIGGLLCFWAMNTLREEASSLFLEQAAYAGSLAGQFCILAGLMVAGADFWQIGLAAGALGAFLFAIIPVFIHRVWASGLAAVGLMAGIPGELGSGHLAPLLITAVLGWLWLTELDDGCTALPKATAGYGLLLALALPLVGVGLPEWGQWSAQGAGPWIEGVDLTLYPGFALLTLVGGGWAAVRNGLHRLPVGVRVLAGGGLALIGGLALVAPGIVPFLLAVLMGFAHGNRVLSGLGVALLILYMGRIYYDLHVTLLTKSGLLVAVGLGLLGLRMALRRWIGGLHREAEYA